MTIGSGAVLNLVNMWFPGLFSHSHTTRSPLPGVLVPPAVFRDLPARPHGVFFQKQPVDLLKGQIAGLGVAEVDERNEREVEAHEDEIALPG